MPMCLGLVKQIHQLTELECAELSATHPLLSLIATHSSDGKVDSLHNKGLFVVGILAGFVFYKIIALL